MNKIETDDYVVRYKDDLETRDKIFFKIIEYCTKRECFNSQTVKECSFYGILDTTEILSDIVDNIVCFKQIWK